ncbi:MAG TPA: metal-sensitive transcriptional regulator [Gammaproteobacteria bacterium]
MKTHPEHPADHHDQLKRLARIRGQIDGIGRMIEEDRYCVDILVQMRAVHAALRKVEEQVLRGHVEHCVAGALKSPDAEQGREKLDELFAVLGRYGM